MSISKANNLFFECGDMSGPPEHRHQVEFSDEVAQFFSDEERDAELIAIQLPNRHILPDRPLTDRRNSGYHFGSIWRLGLPPRAQWGEVYVGRVVRLERQVGGVYRIYVADSGSDEARQWATNAQWTGTIRVTGQITDPGRVYGYW